MLWGPLWLSFSPVCCGLGLMIPSPRWCFVVSVIGCGGVVHMFVESSSCLCGEYGMIAGQLGSREGMFVLELSPV